MTREPMVLLTVRVPRKLREAANAKAAERDERVAEVVRKALERYVSRK